MCVCMCVGVCVSMCGGGIHLVVQVRNVLILFGPESVIGGYFRCRHILCVGRAVDII